MRNIIVLLVIGVIALSCTPYDKKKLEAPLKKMQEPEEVAGSSKTGKPPKNGLVFYNIDNKVYVYVNDSLAFESELIFENPKLFLPVELSSYLVEGNNDVKIRLWNEGCDGCHHNYWYIRYELYEDGEVIDYFYDDANRIFQDEGFKLEKIHELYYAP